MGPARLLSVSAGLYGAPVIIRRMDRSCVGVTQILVGWRLPVPLNPSSITQESPLLVAATITPTFAQL